jgi:hypothetical protein
MTHLKRVVIADLSSLLVEVVLQVIVPCCGRKGQQQKDFDKVSDALALHHFILHAY